MKVKSLVLLTGLALSIFSYTVSASEITDKTDSVLAGATVIDFESVAAGSYSSFLTNDITFGSDTGRVVYVLDAYTGNYGAVNHSVQNTYSGDGFGTLTVTFADTVSFFAFNWGASDTQWTLQALDVNGDVLETVLPAVTTSSNDGFTGINYGSKKIKSFTLSGDVTDYVFVDNLQIAAVPEPETYALMLAGLALVGFSARRKLA